MSRPQLVARYVWGWSQLRATDVLVASFPRSGSTRLRLILAGLATPDESAIRCHSEFERTVPELGGPPPWDRQLELPLFIKTHRPYSFLLSRPRAILLVRHPLDAVASFHAYRSALIGATSLTPPAFLRDTRVGLPRWIRHTCSWLEHAEGIVRFNALRDQPGAAVSTLLKGLGVSYHPERLTRAIGRATPETARQLRATRRGGDQLDPAFSFARRNSDQPRVSFAQEDEAWAYRQLDEAGLMPLIDTL